MPVLYYSGNYKLQSERKKDKVKYWMNKGCSKNKAEKLVERYGY